MIRLLITLTLAFFTIWNASAQTSRTGINLSIWPSLSTQRLDTIRGNTLLNIGLNSRMNRLKGIGVNVLGATTMRSVHGVQAAGLFNITKGDVRGIQVAGITNVTGTNLWGASLSGLVGIVGTDVNGLMVSGGVNIIGGGVQGIAASGLVNVLGGESNGVQIAGISNVSGGSTGGLQLAGLFNVSGGDMVGFQISALLNIAAHEIHGMQIGMLNVANHAKGLQVGLFNFYGSEMEGFQLGLINANPTTRIQLLLSAGSSTLFNLGMRFKNRTYYTIVGLGSKYRELHPFNLSLTYRAGVALPIAETWELSGDLGFQHIETFRKNEPVNRLMNLQARLNGEWQLQRNVGLIFTAGYEQAYTYSHQHHLHNGFFIELGTALNIGHFSIQ